MQRHRHQGVGFAEDLAPGPRHPLAHGGGEVEPVAIFERMHEVAGDIVEAHRGAGAPIGGRIGDRLHGENAGAGIIGERNPEAFAIGRGDERDLGPARRAQPAAAADRLAACRAQRRQGGIEHQAEGGAAELGQAGNAGPVSDGIADGVSDMTGSVASLRPLCQTPG